MKYKELIQFEPITTVIELVSANVPTTAENLVKSFVFSDKMINDIETIVINNLMPDPTQQKKDTVIETKGIQIVGSYGTGKSHLMSVVSAIAENQNLLQYVKREDLKKGFERFAGKYKVLRFELGTDATLKDIFFDRIEKYLAQIGVSFSFDRKSTLSWKVLIQQMMAAFEEKYPHHHFLIVIDEVLEYLRGRNPTELNNDLMLLRQIGEACDKSRFKFMFGVQELLYRSPELQHAADMLLKVEDRYNDLFITKSDVAFVVKERLLKKDIHQKEKIREHLLKFSHLFDGINNKLNEFVDLFPVHPDYITYFEQIKHGKHQREILKVLSNRFRSSMEEDVPYDNPGLVTYDEYWDELSQSSSLSIPDFRTLIDKMEIIEERINNHFTGARANRKELALRIAKTLAIRILCDDLDKKNGASAQSLKEDICTTIPGVEDSEFLLDNIESTAKQLINATSGQYVDRDHQGNFYIRTEGGLNIPKIVEAYAFEVLKKKPEDADQYFFEFLQYVLEIKQNTSYRTGFKIWKHSLTWKDKNSFRLGYIFFGNPNERSTTVPIQQFYIYYCPIFAGIERNDEPDEVYFDFSALSEEFKSTILRYGAASAKEVSASTDQKKLYRNQIEEQLKLALSLFEREFVEKTVVIHTKETRPLKSWSLKGEGSTKQIIFSDVTSRILDDYFNDKYPDYPAFKDLRNPLTETNFDDTIKNALKKIVEPERPNRDGEAILAGLGLWSGQSILVDNSRYANRILQRIKDASGGTVINKSEIIYAHHEDQKLYYSVDYNLDHQLQFVVLVALVFKGDIEIIWSQAKSLTAGNMDIVLSMPTDDYFTFSYIKRPQGIPYSALKSLFSVLGLPDFSNQLDNHETIQKILTAVTTKTGKVTETLSRIRDGVKCRNIDLLPPEELKSVKAGLEKLTKTLDGISAYNTSGKLKLFKLTGEELKADFQAFEFCNIIESLKKRADEFEKLAGYLAHAVSYLPDDIPLRIRINGALSRLGEVIIKDNKTELKQYETLLKSLKDEYIKYYLESYLKYRLSASDYLVRETLLSGKEKLLCDQLKDVVLTDKSEYQKLIDELSQLKEADHSLSKDRLETVPYDGFNPRDYHSKPKPDILSLKQRLEYILESWKNLVVSTLKDPGLSGNLDYLPSGRQKLIKDILNSETEITLDNAGELRAAITGLMQGIDKVEISQDEITKLFNRPLSPSEAIDNFTSFIEELSKGKERVKVRIILKNATTH